jgi:tetratricopeptide (TPR) repeat protein
MSGWQNLGRLYVLKGDKAKAIDAADQMMKAASAAPPAGGQIGTTMAVPMAGGPGAAGAPGAAQIYLDAGAPEKALAVYGPDYAAQIEKSGPMLTRYVQFWAQQGTNLDSALATAKKVTELSPAAYSSFSSLATVYQKMRNYGEALKAAEKALSLLRAAASAQGIDPEDDRRHQNSGCEEVNPGDDRPSPFLFFPIVIDTGPGA